jgi:large subunit ribosomal protein L4
MKIDVVNSNKETVGSLDLKDEVFGGLVKTDLIWEAVVHENAQEHRGTHATKNRANVSGSGKKPWRQKGTGRAGGICGPALARRKAVSVSAAPRSYDYAPPRGEKAGEAARGDRPSWLTGLRRSSRLDAARRGEAGPAG